MVINFNVASQQIITIKDKKKMVQASCVKRHTLVLLVTDANCEIGISIL